MVNSNHDKKGRFAKGNTLRAEKKSGRPALPIDWQDVVFLCSIHCTLEEVAAKYSMGASAFRERVEKEYGMGWTEFYEQHQAGGKVSLRRLMWEQAEKGNITMQIWLSKNVLGYTDRLEQTGKDGKSQEIIVKVVYDGSSDKRDHGAPSGTTSPAA